MQSWAFCFDGAKRGRKQLLICWQDRPLLSMCLSMFIVDGCGAHADVMLGWWRILWPPSDCDKGALLLFLLLVTSGYCCCCWSSGDVLLLPLASCLDSCPSWSELASDFSKAFSRSNTEFLSYSSLMCSFNTSTSSRTAYIRWLFTRSWKTWWGKFNST